MASRRQESWFFQWRTNRNALLKLQLAWFILPALLPCLTQAGMQQQTAQFFSGKVVCAWMFHMRNILPLAQAIWVRVILFLSYLGYGCCVTQTDQEQECCTRGFCEEERTISMRHAKTTSDCCTCPCSTALLSGTFLVECFFMLFSELHSLFEALLGRGF